jgi:hypothetical protein
MKVDSLDHSRINEDEKPYATNDASFLSTFGINQGPHEHLSQRDLDFLAFKAQQREHLQKKLHMLGKIESL